MPKTQINPLYSTLETIAESEDLTPYQLLTMSPSVLKYFPLARLLAVAAAASCAWEDITGKPSTFSPETHTHAQYLESVAWSIITGKPSTYPPESHMHSQYLESVAWSIITGKPSTYPPETHMHSQYLESVAWSIITGKPSTYPPETHTHSGEYVPYDHGMGVMGASWTGNGEAARTINLSYSVGIATLQLMVLMSWFNASTYALRIWSSIFASGLLYVLSNGGCSIDVSQWTFTGGATSISVVQNINQSSWNYRLFMLGWRS